MPDRLLRRPEVETLTGLKRSAIYEWMSRREFPLPVALGKHRVAWRESDIQRWIAERQSRTV